VLETYAALALTLVALAIYARRLRAASRPKRRALLAVAVTSLLFLPAYFVFNLSAWILKLDPGVLDGMAWAIVVTRVLMPLGFLIALVQAELFAARALRDLLGRLATRPTPDAWRRMIASALDDPELRLAYYDPDTESFRESDGATLVHPAAGSSRTWVPVDRGGLPVAAMVIDDALAEDPELVRAAASATLLAVENGHLEGELRASRARIVEAGIAERRRIERDLHDSAQQRLVALRIRLSLAGELLDRSDERAMLERFGVEVDEAIDELRNVAHGIYPQVLAQGVQAALAAGGRRTPAHAGDDQRRAAPALRGADRDDGLLLLRRVPAERREARRAGSRRHDSPG
jgi:signal transduction histidine kinase